MKPILHVSIIALALVAFINTASADGITVGNFSFEDPTPPTPPGYEAYTSITDWSFSGSGGVQTYASSSDITSLGDGDGLNYAWINLGPGSITYTGTLPTVVAGDSYTLSVGMDNRSQTSTGSLELSLIVGGTSFFTTTVPEASLPTNTFELESVTLTSAETLALGGQSLGIQMGSTDSGFQADFDNVTLTETAAPEPSTWALMGFGGLVFLVALNRIRNRA
jgi:hypothetical protein